MKKSAKLLKEYISDSELYMVKNMRHGEISLVDYEQYLEVIKMFIEKQEKIN